MEHNENLIAVKKLNERIIEWASSEISEGTSRDPAIIDAYGKVIDMVKDLSMAESYLSDADQSASIVKAMRKADEGGYRMGYNPNRNRMGQYSDGRAGNRNGYDDGAGTTRRMDGRDMDGTRDRMGYTQDHHQMMMDKPDYDPRYGRSFNRYREAKRHYHATKSDKDMQDMRDASNESMTDAIAAFQELYESGDADQRARLKSSLNKLVADMK